MSECLLNFIRVQQIADSIFRQTNGLSLYRDKSNLWALLTDDIYCYQVMRQVFLSLYH